MLELQRLRDDHLDAVCVFERENRSYFGRFITDRGDAFYERIAEHHRTMVAEQDAGVCVFGVLVDTDDQTIVGRFNLYDLADGVARVGYRVAERVAGRGVTTSALRELCRRAADEYGLHTLNAETSDANVASQRVLEKAGFVRSGTCVVAGKPGLTFALKLGMEITAVNRARRTSGLVVLEGFHAIKHAIRFGAELLGAWTADPDALETLRQRLAADVQIPVEVVDGAALAAVVPRGQVVAVARRPSQPDPDTVLAGPGHVVLLEDPRHLGNLGAVIRVAAAAGAAGVMTTGQQNPWHPDALRGSAGLHFALPVHHLRAVRTQGRQLIALDPEGEPLAPEAFPQAAVLAFGTERDGLSGELLSQAHRRVALPMAAGVSSMNLATAVAATLYALRFGA